MKHPRPYIKFDFFHKPPVDRILALRRRKFLGQSAPFRPTAWIYSHLPLAMGVVATGIGLDFVLTGHTGAGERWILAGGLTVAMLAMALILFVTINPSDPRTKQKALVRLATIPIVLGLGAIGGELAMGLTTTVLALLIAAQVFSDLLFEPH